MLMKCRLFNFEQAPVLEWFDKLTRIAMRVSPANTLSHVRRTGNASLRAWLLIEAATERAHAPAPQRTRPATRFHRVTP